MTSLNIEIDEKNIIFTTQLSIRVSDLNYAGHLGNDRFISLVHEARVRFFDKLGWSEVNIADTNIGIIISDLVVNYKNQGMLGEQIEIGIAIENVKSRKFDMLYLLKKTTTGQLLGKCMTRQFFFDYKANKVAQIPDQFNAVIEREKAGE